MAEIQDENSPALTPLQQVRAAMEKAAGMAGRDSGDITLIAISKTKSADEIMPVLEQGHRIYGENRVQEAQDKWPALKEKYPDVRLHMVGQLQSNKADDAVEFFDAIHSVDRSSLVKALRKAMKKTDRQVDCFVQVNIGEEEQKGGCEIKDLPGLLELAEKHGLPIKGLMCVPPLGLEPSPYFALLAKLAKDNALPALSMGMSGDFEAAIKTGATHIRVGSALFGSRD